MQLENAVKGRRFVLLAGAARSGTTWLGNILNSSPRCVYSHEPLLRLPQGDLQPLWTKIRETGQLSAGERDLYLRHLSRAYFAVHRPPFFPKDFTRFPARLTWACWLAVQGMNRGYRLFERTFTPPGDADFDLVIKQGGGTTLYGKQIVSALSPGAMIVIVRHPCSVVASIRRGQSLGLMHRVSREKWFDDYLSFAEPFGHDRRQIEQMSDAEFQALCWLLENTAYKELLERHPHGRLVNYDDLSREPLAIARSLYESLGWEVTDQTRCFIRETGNKSPSGIKWLTTSSHPYFSVYRTPSPGGNPARSELTPYEMEQVLAVTAPLREFYTASELDMNQCSR